MAARGVNRDGPVVLLIDRDVDLLGQLRQHLITSVGQVGCAAGPRDLPVQRVQLLELTVDRLDGPADLAVGIGA